MAFRNRPATNAGKKRIPPPTHPSPRRTAPAPTPARKPASPAPTRTPARIPAPLAPPVQEQEEEFFEPGAGEQETAQGEFGEEQEVPGEEEFYEEQQDELEPAQRPTSHRSVSTRAPQHAPVSRSYQSGSRAGADNKIRLTGIWESKGSRDILRGGLRELGPVIDFLARCEQEGKKVQVLTYRNNVNKQGDPPFTVYLQIDDYVPGQSGGRGRGGWNRGGGNYSRGGRENSGFSRDRGDSRDQF